MANSKGRRKRRRALQEAGLYMPPEIPPVPPPIPLPRAPEAPNSLLRQVRERSGKWVGSFVGLIALIVAIDQWYPWLSVQQNYMVKSSNPYTESFSITNEGYAIITDLDADCLINTYIPGFGQSTNNHLFNDGFKDELGHASKVTVPCQSAYLITGNNRVPVGSTLDIRISYYYYHLHLWHLKPHQDFHFISVIDDEGNEHWNFQ